MSENVQVSTYNGVGFLGLLTLLFIGLKLTGYIAWSWVWVLSPLWIPVAVTAGLFFIFAFIAVLGEYLSRNK